jgi:hypothetical protein
MDGTGKLKGIPVNNYYEVEDLINGLLALQTIKLRRS